MIPIAEIIQLIEALSNIEGLILVVIIGFLLLLAMPSILVFIFTPKLLEHLARISEKLEHIDVIAEKLDHYAVASENRFAIIEEKVRLLNIERQPR